MGTLYQKDWPDRGRQRPKLSGVWQVRPLGYILEAQGVTFSDRGHKSWDSGASQTHVAKCKKRKKSGQLPGCYEQLKKHMLAARLFKILLDARRAEQDVAD
jgi:hypothetical protein